MATLAVHPGGGSLLHHAASLDKYPPVRINFSASALPGCTNCTTCRVPRTLIVVFTHTGQLTCHKSCTDIRLVFAHCENRLIPFTNLASPAENVVVQASTTKSDSPRTPLSTHSRRKHPRRRTHHRKHKKSYTFKPHRHHRHSAHRLRPHHHRLPPTCTATTTKDPEGSCPPTPPLPPSLQKSKTKTAQCPWRHIRQRQRSAHQRPIAADATRFRLESRGRWPART